MDPATIISLLELAAKAGIDLYNAYKQGQIVLSATDAQAVKDALTKAEAATAALRPQVDAALLAASQN